MTMRNVLPFRRPPQLRSIVSKLVAAGVSPARMASHIGIAERELRHWLTTAGTSLPPKVETALMAYVKNLRKLLATKRDSD
jgi:hypothetical protein